MLLPPASRAQSSRCRPGAVRLLLAECPVLAVLALDFGQGLGAPPAERWVTLAPREMYCFGSDRTPVECLNDTCPLNNLNPTKALRLLDSFYESTFPLGPDRLDCSARRPGHGNMQNSSLFSAFSSLVHAYMTSIPTPSR